MTKALSIRRRRFLVQALAFWFIDRSLKNESDRFAILGPDGSKLEIVGAIFISDTVTGNSGTRREMYRQSYS